ncbi:MAG TPA: glycosidase [Roseburia sp.]|nr:glycosidase [Roseburia sp.]
MKDEKTRKIIQKEEKMGERRFSTKNRFVSFLLAIAMVLTLLPIGAVQAKAEEAAVKLYFELPNGTSVNDWCVNAWGNSVTISGDEEHKFRPSTWGAVDEEHPEFPALFQADDEKWGYVTISGTIDGLQFVNKEGTEYKCWNAQIANEGYKEAYFDPSVRKWYTGADKSKEIQKATVRDIYVISGETALTGFEWGIHNDNSLTKDGNKYSITFTNVSAGTYSYKILQDPENCGWDKPWGSGSGSGGNRSVTIEAPSDVTFTIDLTDTSKNVEVSQKKLKKLVVDNGNISKGQTKELSTSAEYYDGTSADVKTVTVSYQLKSPMEGVTLDGNKLTVAKNVNSTEVIVIASYGDFTQELTIPVVEKQYRVTINMYSQDLEMKPGVSDIYIFENGGSDKNNTTVTLNKAVEDTENKVTWVQGTVTVPYNSLGIIARDKAGTWDGGQDGNRFYTIDKNTSEVTLWYVYGKTPVTEKPTITKEDPRYFYLEYENDTLTTTPEFYSWTTGFAAELKKFESAGAGKWKIKVPVKSSCTKVDFVVVLDPSGSDWIKDGGDHSIAFPQEQNVVCASMKKGEEPVLSAPYNKGYEVLPKENKIAFYFRDDNALIEDKLSDMNVSVDIDGKEYPMTYNAENKRFEYNYNELKSGRTLYRYKVGEKYILDKYNDKKEKKDGNDYSYIEYYKLNASIQAEVMNASFNYNENNVVKFTVNQDENEKKLEVASASIDVSSLGGSSALAIVPDLQAVTISATTDTTLGKKTLPIVVTDQYGNEYTTSVQVEVAARNKKNADDFDWDESVIYFMVTDRFFDGNESNNTASGAKTYGKDNAGLYHGGDFAGITQKLDYLEDLGINTIWITPIVENIPGVTVTDTGKEDVPYNAAYHGYWASDFTKLNPTLGTEEEFQTLIDQAHSRGIRIMVDIVVNHAGYDTEFGNMIRSGDDVVSGSDQKDSLSNLPDFRTEDPAVSAQLVEWQTQWVKDFGIDYFRVDTVKHVENDTWAELKNALTKTDPNFKMIGEYAGGGYASNGNTLGTGEMDSDLDFDFNDQAANFVKGNISSVENFLASRNSALNNTYMTGQFLGSHDEDGFKQKLLDGGMKEDAATAASMVAASLQITAKGQPVVYYGEEIGLTGLNNYPYQTNRYDFDWSMVNNDNKTYQHYKKMLSIRNAYTDVFARGDRKTIVASDEKGYDIVSRSYQGTKLYVGLNIKGAAQTVEVPVSESNGTILKDLYSGTSYTVNNGKVEVTIPAAADGGTVVLKKNSSGGSSSSSGSTTTETKPSEDIKKDTTTEITVPSEKLPAGTKATVTVTKSGDGKVTAEAAVEAAGKTTKTGVKATVNADVIKAVTEAAGTKDVIITQEVKKADGTTAYTLQVNAADVKAGAKLAVMKKDEKTGELVLVNRKAYKVAKDGSVSLTFKGEGTYVVKTQAEVKAEAKQIAKTVKPAKTTVKVAAKKTTVFKWNKKLNMENVAKITYKSSKKSVVSVNKNGKITGKKKGTGKVTAEVTLKDGTKKTVKMKVKVK